jgi:hypothetical protein
MRTANVLGLCAVLVVPALLLVACGDSGAGLTATPTVAPTPTRTGPVTEQEVLAETRTALESAIARATFPEIEDDTLMAEQMTEGEAVDRIGRADVVVEDTSRQVWLVSIRVVFAGFRGEGTTSAGEEPGTWYRVVPVDGSVSASYFVADSGATP